MESTSSVDQILDICVLVLEFFLEDGFVFLSLWNLFAKS